MYNLLRRGYIADIGVLILVTIILGSAGAWVTAWATHGFFARTATGILGEQGEHDIVVYVRSDSRLEAREALQAIVRAAGKGAGVSDGITLLGKVHFMVGLGPPGSVRDQARFEWTLRVIEDIPGYIGRSIATEPRVTLSGMSRSTASAVKELLAGKNGVAFVLQDGSNLHMILKSSQHVTQVADEAERVLAGFHSVQAQTSNGRPVDIDKIKNAIEGSASAYASHPVRVYGSIGSSDAVSDETSEALSVIRRTAIAWAPCIAIDLKKSVDIRRGDTLWIGPRPGRITAVVTDVDGSRCTALATEGNLAGVLTGEAQLWATDDRGNRVGKARAASASLDLADALDSIERSTSGVGAVAATAAQQAEDMMRALDSYSAAAETLSQLQNALESTGAGIGRPLSLDGVELLLKLTNRSIDAIDRLSTLASGVAMFSSSYDGLNDDLAEWRSVLAGFRDRLDAVYQAASGLGGGAGLVGEIGQTAGEVVAYLEQLDAESMKIAFSKAQQDLQTLADLDSGGVKEAIDKIRLHSPELSGEEAVALVRTIDRLRGASDDKTRADLLVKADMDPDELARNVQHRLGSDYTVLVSPVGMVQRGIGAEVSSLLAAVRSTITGIVSIAVCTASLMIDHAIVGSGALAMIVPGANRRSRERVAVVVYSAVVGSITLWAIAGISGGRLGHMGLWVFAPIGAGLGIVSGMLAGRLAPCDPGEVEAGVAWGISPACVMREVIVPAGRPGLLNLANRGQQMFADWRRISVEGSKGDQGGMELCSNYKM